MPCASAPSTIVANGDADGLDGVPGVGADAGGNIEFTTPCTTARVADSSSVVPNGIGAAGGVVVELDGALLFVAGGLGAAGGVVIDGTNGLDAAGGVVVELDGALLFDAGGLGATGGVVGLGAAGFEGAVEGPLAKILKKLLTLRRVC